MKSKSAAVNRARQFALIIGTTSCAIHAHMASQIDSLSVAIVVAEILH